MVFKQFSFTGDLPLIFSDLSYGPDVLVGYEQVPDVYVPDLPEDGATVVLHPGAVLFLDEDHPILTDRPTDEDGRVVLHAHLVQEREVSRPAQTNTPPIGDSDTVKPKPGRAPRRNRPSRASAAGAADQQPSPDTDGPAEDPEAADGRTAPQPGQDATPALAHDGDTGLPTEQGDQPTQQSAAGDGLGDQPAEGTTNQHQEV